VLNKVVVVTGANAGIGFQAALNLSRMGAQAACRSMDRARKAHNEILAAVPDARAVIIPLDVSEPASIQEFVRRFSGQMGQLDLLINNAGIVP